LQIVLSGERDLLVHLKMTGQLIFVDVDGKELVGVTRMLIGLMIYQLNIPE
jgi:hypothetical protein